MNEKTVVQKESEEEFGQPGTRIVEGSSVLYEQGDVTIGRVVGSREVDGKYGRTRAYFLQKANMDHEVHYTKGLAYVPLGAWVKLRVTEVIGKGENRKRKVDIEIMDEYGLPAKRKEDSPLTEVSLDMREAGNGDAP